MAHRDAPIPHRAARFGFGDRGKPLQCLGIPERVQGPNGLFERLLDGRPTGDLKVNFTRRLRHRGTSIRAYEGWRWSREILANCPARQIAAQRTKELRIKFRDGEHTPGFGMPIRYEPLKPA